MPEGDMAGRGPRWPQWARWGPGSGLLEGRSSLEGGPTQDRREAGPLLVTQPWGLKGEGESISQQKQHGLWVTTDARQHHHCSLLTQWAPVPSSRFAKAIRGQR